MSESYGLLSGKISGGTPGHGKSEVDIRRVSWTSLSTLPSEENRGRAMYFLAKENVHRHAVIQHAFLFTTHLEPPFLFYFILFFSFKSALPSVMDADVNGYEKVTARR